MEFSFPQEMIREILLRLPIKTLGRVKSVCHSWDLTISMESFKKEHLGRNSVPRILFGRGFSIHPFYSFEIKDMPPPIVKSVRLPIFEKKPLYRMIGSCNGLVCCITVEQDIVVFNPVTGIERLIPPPPTGEKLTPTIYGFAYENSSDDYLIFKFGGEKDVEKGEYKTDLQIFSLRLSSWKKLDFDIPDGCVVMPANDGVFFQGCMHWNLWNNMEKCFKVLAHDLRIQNFPHSMVSSLPLDDSSGISLAVAADSLFICYHYEKKVDVWRISEYPNWKSARKVCSLPNPDRYLYSKARHLIYVDEEGKLSVFTRGLGLTLLHLSSKMNIMPNYIVKAVVYQESLISPFFS